MTAEPAETTPSHARPTGPRNALLGWLRVGFVWVFAAALVWFAGPTPLEWGIGLGLAAIGEWIRCWSAGYLIKSKKLITGGPYQFVRNPLYLGRFFILSGVCIAAAFPPYYVNLYVLAAALLVFFFYYIPRKEKVEPARLERLHGEPYRAYRDAVPSLFPRLTPYGNPQGKWLWSNFTENEEYNMVVALTVFFGVVAFHAGVI